jgi:hypothetical protein
MKTKRRKMRRKKKNVRKKTKLKSGQKGQPCRQKSQYTEGFLVWACDCLSHHPVQGTAERSELCRHCEARAAAHRQKRERAKGQGSEPEPLKMKVSVEDRRRMGNKMKKKRMEMGT